jgi:hypothetical protein
MELPVLNYERLLAGDKLETQKMINALSGQGLFFLDLDGPTCKQSLEDLGPVYRQQRKFFEEPMEVKNRYHSGLRYKGWVCGKLKRFSFWQMLTACLAQKILHF